MKQLLTFIGLFLTAPLFAFQTPLGTFKGIAFSGVTSRHPVQFTGGNFSHCDTERSLEVTQCKVDGAKLVVNGSPEHAMNAKLTQVSILKTDNRMLSYYYRGTTELQIGDRIVSVPIGVTLSVEINTPDRLVGLIELPNQMARTSFEAYLVP